MNPRITVGYDSANGVDTTVVIKTTNHTHAIIDTFTRTTGTSWGSSSGGDWWPVDPDMTDWPADDILDYYARDLARRRPA